MKNNGYEIQNEITSIKKLNLEQLYLLLKYSLITSIKTFSTFGMKNEVTKNSLSVLEEFFKIYSEERKILKFLNTNKNRIDINATYEILDKLDELNEKTFKYYYDVLDAIEDACDMQDINRTKRPIKNFNTLIESTEIHAEVVSLLATMKSIQDFLKLPYEFWVFIQSKIKIAELSSPIASQTSYVHPVFNNDNLICDIHILLPEIIDLNTAIINIKLLAKAYDIYKCIGMDKAYFNDELYNDLPKKYKMFLDDRLTLNLKR